MSNSALKKWATIIGLLVASAFVALTFNNCSDVSFSQKPANTNSSVAGNSATTTGDEVAPDDVVQTVISNCSAAAKNNTLLTHTKTIVFHDTKIESGRPRSGVANDSVCLFGQGDNLTTQDATMRARYEQVRNLDLPSNAVICDIQIEDQEQTIRYDDVFFLNFNGFLLATNNKSAIVNNLDSNRVALQGSSTNLLTYKYDWLKVRDVGFGNVVDDYCVGKAESLSSCTWPLTEKSGNIQFDFDPEILIRFSAQVPAQNQSLSMVITGDNDYGIDCYHSELSFNVKVYYYQ